MSLDPVVTSNSSARRWTERIHDALKKEVFTDLNLLPPVCVLQVPNTLSDQKPEAYIPQLIGMGPYHHLRPELYQMERYKLAVIKEFLDPAQVLNFKHFLIDKLRENEDLALRACYNRFMDMDEETLAWIVAIDGLFLLNFLYSAYGNNDMADDDHEHIVHDNIFTRDFLMLENQIPFVILKKIRMFLRLSSPSASQLCRHARVKCRPIREGGLISRIKFEEPASTLHLPVITVNAGSEVILRNLVVYEAAMSKTKLEFARYINLMNGIAATTEDVSLLRKNGVIKGNLTDDEVADMFSSMQMSFARTSRSSNVGTAAEKVNKYYDQQPIVRARRGLKNNASISWKFLAVASSISLVLLLTFQTFCSMYSCHNILGNRH